MKKSTVHFVVNNMSFETCNNIPNLAKIRKQMKKRRERGRSKTLIVKIENEQKIGLMKTQMLKRRKQMLKGNKEAERKQRLMKKKGLVRRKQMLKGKGKLEIISQLLLKRPTMQKKISWQLSMILTTLRKRKS